MAAMKKKTGRPKLDIDSEQVEKLAQIQCTNVEIAAFFGCDESTIRDRFPEQLKKGREAGKISLRRKQFQVAQGGNVSMLIWLGKQYLGQTDKPVGDGNETPTPVKVIIQAEDGRRNNQIDLPTG